MLILHKHCMGIGCINSAAAAVGHTYSTLESLLYCNSTLKMGAAHIMFSGHAINMKQHENVTFIQHYLYTHFLSLQLNTAHYRRWHVKGISQ